jgi:hypothetical protein
MFSNDYFSYHHLFYIQQQTNNGFVNGIKPPIFSPYRGGLRMSSPLANQSFPTDAVPQQLIKQDRESVSYPRTLTPTNTRRMNLSKVSVMAIITL